MVARLMAVPVVELLEMVDIGEDQAQRRLILRGAIDFPALFRALIFMEESSSQLLDEALASSDPELRQRAVMMAAGQGPGIWPWPWPRPMPRPMP